MSHFLLCRRQTSKQLPASGVMARKRSATSIGTPTGDGCEGMLSARMNALPTMQPTRCWDARREGVLLDGVKRLNSTHESVHVALPSFRASLQVFQRQLSKKGLQTIVVEEGDEVNSISTDDLRCVEVTTAPVCRRHPQTQATRLLPPPAFFVQ